MLYHRSLFTIVIALKIFRKWNTTPIKATVVWWLIYYDDELPVERWMDAIYEQFDDFGEVFAGTVGETKPRILPFPDFVLHSSHYYYHQLRASLQSSQWTKLYHEQLPFYAHAQHACLLDGQQPRINLCTKVVSTTLLLTCSLIYAVQGYNIS